jgi:transmembrane sensor
MGSDTSSMEALKKPSPAARAEAAAWIARLHGPNRTADVEAGFRRWLAEDAEHAAAVELLTDVWEKSARLRRRTFEQVASWEFPGFRLSFSRAAFASFAIALVAAVATFLYLHTDAVVTGVGEQRLLVLDDGTRVYLNTDTEVVTNYDKAARRVELRKGEAMFEVAKRPQWPFIVTAGDRQVRALGTAFVVRREKENVAVTLVEGKVTVSPIGISEDFAHHPVPAPFPPREADTQDQDRSGPAEKPTITLTPGDRLTFIVAQAPRIDRPAIEKVTAWQRGKVALDDTPLSDAVAEMNRYSTTRLVVEDPETAAIRVSGIFRAGDQEDFARAVARTYQLEIRDGAREIVLVGAP